MRNSSSYFLVMCIVALVMFLPTIGVAQPGDPGGGNPDSPITGIEILIGGGVLLGIRKLVNARKQK